MFWAFGKDWIKNSCLLHNKLYLLCPSKFRHSAAIYNGNKLKSREWAVKHKLFCKGTVITFMTHLQTIKKTHKASILGLIFNNRTNFVIKFGQSELLWEWYACLGTLHANIGHVCSASISS